MGPNSLAERPGLAGLIARSLTGEQVLVGEAAELSGPAEIAAALVAAGWPVERVLGVRDQRADAGLGWPVLVPADERGGWGLAQLHAVSQLVLDELGGAPPARVRAADQPLSTHDRALIADRPPHHGTVG